MRTTLPDNPNVQIEVCEHGWVYVGASCSFCLARQATLGAIWRHEREQPRQNGVAA